MKKIIIAIFLTSLIWSCKTSSEDTSGFNINGTVTGFQDSIIFLKKREAGKWETIDSCVVKNDTFTFKGRIEQPEMYYLLNKKTDFFIPIYLENSTISVIADVKNPENVKITGSKAQDAFNSYNKEVKIYNDKLKDLYKQYSDAQEKGDNALTEKIDSSYSAVDKEKTAFTKAYIGSHNKSIVIPYILYHELSYSASIDELDSLLSLIDTSLSVSPYYKIINDRIQILKNVAAGKKAPVFTLNDTTGNPISSAQFQGKYLLIDFWASWCRPCRVENPNNVKLYADYKDKGFEILGVSFDKDRNAWIQAIKNDNLTWMQVSDLKGWNSSAGKLYGINSIPHTVLIDKNGIIIANNLRSDELRAKLSELLD
ncbi:MAG: AhpC/TSA family protein [Chlorobi bacterium]|nr:AhpC/TSA family protein [Chlorobiota bacterium]